ncbi:MAG TPA: hypothetical protein VMT18_12300 [Planctomycetota bacterium]|nr:hypothetical protein [Planctomycetota bacterium]
MALDFERELRPRLMALPFFRAPTDDEIDGAYAAYQSGEHARLCEVWREVASAQRATLTPALQRGYDHAGLLPAAVNAHGFLASVRAALDAGVRFRAGLSAPTRACLESDFPWLQRRHEHVPPGWTPRFDFPVEFAMWIDVLDRDTVRARWQLACGLNEVQQAHNSEDCARRFRLPELRRHAARERELAIHYFRHQAPRVDRATFRACLYVLDGLNAAVFAMLCRERPGEMIRRSVAAALTRRAEWQAFVRKLDATQWLMPLPAAASHGEGP